MTDERRLPGSWWSGLLPEGVVPDLEGGVWRLHPQDEVQFFADYLPEPFLQKVFSVTPVKGWRAAVEEGLPLLRPDIADYTRDYFLEPYRSDFVEGLGLTAGADVLDLGCGWGFASQRCLEKGTRVVGTEAAPRRLQFCLERFAQQGFGDRFLAVEMDANRPFVFRPGAFDAVIVSGLMEWLPSSTVGDAEAIQRRFLQRCATVLKPGGRLYLAIENRYWWQYFVGARDLHRIHRLQVLTSILPRRLARALAVLVTGTDYRTYTYSFLDYLEMLRDAGFRSTDADYPDPDYVQPRRVTRICRGVALQANRGQMRRAVRVQRPRAGQVRFGRSFTFVATR